MSKSQVKEYLEEIKTDKEMVSILVESLVNDEDAVETVEKVNSLIKKRYVESKKNRN